MTMFWQLTLVNNIIQWWLAVVDPKSMSVLLIAPQIELINTASRLIWVHMWSSQWFVVPYQEILHTRDLMLLIHIWLHIYKVRRIGRNPQGVRKVTSNWGESLCWRKQLFWGMNSDIHHLFNPVGSQHCGDSILTVEDWCSIGMNLNRLNLKIGTVVWVWLHFEQDFILSKLLFWVGIHSELGSILSKAPF